MWRGPRIVRRVVAGVAVVAAVAVARRPAAAADALATAGRKEVAAALTPGGRARLIHLWATWCAPCVAEWPQLAPALRSWSTRRIDVVTIALDDPSRAGAAARLLADAGGVPGRSLLAAPRDAIPEIQRLDPAWDGAVPSTFLVAPDGTLLLAQRGVTRTGVLQREVDRLARHRAEGASESTEERRRR